jgi:hypothetical protein
LDFGIDLIVGLGWMWSWNTKGQLTFIQLTEREEWRKPCASWEEAFMSLETLFKFASYSVIPFWLLLIFAPRWSWTTRLGHSPVLLLLLTPIYAYMLFGYGATPEGMDFGSLYGVMVGFAAPQIAVAGWIHYLIFDLFVGAWETRDAQRRGVPHLLVIPCLIATLMVGPIGLLLYVLVRFFHRRVLEYDEAGTL